MNKTRSHLHMFKKIKLTHLYFKSSPYIFSSWIDHVDFLHFWSSKIYVSPTDVVFSLSPPQWRLSSGRRYHAAMPCHPSSSGNTPPRRLSSKAEIEALNPHHHHRPPSQNRLTHTLHCCKNVISTLVTLPTTQPCFYFTSSLARAPHHSSSTRRRRSFSLASHAHHPICTMTLTMMN
jgi:hypothetical protein